MTKILEATLEVRLIQLKLKCLMLQVEFLSTHNSVFDETIKYTDLSAKSMINLPSCSKKIFLTV